jgi:hypothetical protein
MDICQMRPWIDLWRGLECVLCTFEEFDLSEDATDATIWQTCQDHDILQITGNRDAEGHESLEMTLRQRNTPNCLSVQDNVDRIGTWLYEHEDAHDMLMSWPQGTEALVTEDALANVDLMDPEALGSLARWFQQQGQAHDAELERLKQRVEIIHEGHRIQTAIQDFERNGLAPGSPDAEHYDWRQLLKTMLAHQVTDPQKAWAMVNAERVQAVGQKEGRIMTERDMAVQGHGRGPITRPYRRRSEVERAQAEGTWPRRSGQMRSGAEVEQRVVRRAAERGIGAPEEPVGATELRDLYRSWYTNQPRPVDGRPPTPASRQTVRAPAPPEAGASGTPGTTPFPGIERLTPPTSRPESQEPAAA